MEGPQMRSANRKLCAVTGSARKIKDNAADWHNLKVRWDKLNDEGFQIAGNIINLKLNRSQSELHQQWVDEAPAPQSAPWQQAAGTADLLNECSKLHHILEKMAIIMVKMQRVMASQRGILDLEEFQFGRGGRKVPLFHSWNTKQLDEASQILFDAFSKELQLKHSILQELAHTATSDLCMVYLSCWLHEPFIPPQTRLILEALLLETGHRPI
ncbi:cyclin-dependent kinase 2-interacting protein [Aulostomus maculatus]